MLNPTSNCVVNNEINHNERWKIFKIKESSKEKVKVVKYVWLVGQLGFYYSDRTLRSKNQFLQSSLFFHRIDSSPITMKTTKQHLDALLAVEGESQFDGIATSIEAFRQKQNVQSHNQQSTFAWIQTSRELSQLEQTISKQLERIQNDIGLLPSPHCQEQLDAMSLVSGLKDALQMSQSNGPRCRKMILDTKQRLNKMEEDLEQQRAVLEAETRVQRYRALQLVSDERKQCDIPAVLRKALDSLRTLDDEDNEVELLKQGLIGELEAAKHEHDMTVHGSTSSSRRMKKAAADTLVRRYDQIKKKGLGDVERLRNRLLEKSRLSTSKRQNETKQQEIHAQLKLLRLQQQLNDTQNQQEALPDSKVEEEKAIGLQQRLESRQALSKHHLDRVQDHEKENEDVLLHSFEEEMMKQRKMSFNKERSAFREEQRENRLLAQQKEEEKSKREREFQLERLSELAMSCPYQKKIADLQPDIHKSTNARQNDFFRRQSDLADFQLGRHRSFTDEKLFSDPKFRLTNALYEAGINKTIAARDVIRNAIPRTEERTTGIKPY
jgi:hypothetical protein